MALEMVGASKPDAILLDVMMPGMNGREFLKALREDLGELELPVVVMSAVPGIDTTRVFGASDVVNKPFDVDELLNKVALAVFRSRADEELPASAIPLDPVSTKYQGVDSDSEGVVMVMIPDRDIAGFLDKHLGERGLTAVSITRVTDELTRLARVLEPRAVVMDVSMDDYAGMDALRALRREPSLAKVPIFAFAGDPKHLDCVREEIEELAQLVPTPVNVEHLVALATAAPGPSRRAS
jgi:CheY-like chemotaxis protein